MVIMQHYCKWCCFRKYPSNDSARSGIRFFGLALGYGRKTNLKEEMQVGVNAYKLYAKANNVQFEFLLKKLPELFMSLLVLKYKKQLLEDMIF